MENWKGIPNIPIFPFQIALSGIWNSKLPLTLLFYCSDIYLKGRYWDNEGPERANCPAKRSIYSIPYDKYPHESRLHLGYEVNDKTSAGQILDKILARVAVCGGSTTYPSLTQRIWYRRMRRCKCVAVRLGQITKLRSLVPSPSSRDVNYPTVQPTRIYPDITWIG